VFTSSEFPTQLAELPFNHVGNPELAGLLAARAREHGVTTIAHHKDSLGLEYGTLVPMHFMQLGRDVKVVPVSGWCAYSTIEESRRVGAAFREAIEASNCRVVVIASGSFSHRIHDNADVLQRPYEISDEFFRQCDLRVLDLWQTAHWPEFNAMLLGTLGWDDYRGKAEIVTPYFVASGTGQANVVLRV
jgi:3,4-dihydroxyphenylacetate 2,3-dioxygenase